MKTNQGAAEGDACAKAPQRRMVTAVGYPLAFAALCALACGPGYAMAADAANGSSGEGSSSGSTAIESSQASNAPVASSKDETVYVFAKADGSVKNVEVSDKLTNAGKSSELADSTTLANIENVEGDGSYRGSGDSIVWDAQGDDVYYKGDSDAALPISMSVTYKLDGRTVNAGDLAGKSGKVEMTYRFANDTKAEGGVQVPLAAITGMLFSNDDFSDIEVDNGKVIDDGDRVVVVGYAMPGLAESLDVDSGTVDIPDSFTVTANATDFKLSSTLTMVTGNLFDSVNMDDLDSGELSDSSSSLKDAMSQLIDGSGSLTEGLQALSDGAGSLADGLSQLDGGASSLAEGLGALASGASDLSDGADALASGTAKLKEEGTQALADGASELAEKTSALPDANAVKTAKQGSEQISAGFGSLKDGVAQLKGDASSGTGLAYAAAAEHQLANGLSSASSLNDVVSRLKSGLKDLSDALGAADGYLASALSDEAAAATQVGTARAALAGITASSLSSADQAALQKAIEELDAASTKLGNASAGAILETGAAQQYVEGASDGVSEIASEAGKVDTSSLSRAATAASQIASGLDTAVAKIGSATDTSDETLYGGVNALATGYDTFSSQVMPLVEGAPTLKAAISQIDAGAKAVNKQMGKVESGADSLADGAGKIDSGAASAAKGAGALAEGAASADAGAGKLADGAGSAAEGSKKLAEGLGQFNSEGISKIVDLIDNKLVKAADNFDALQAAGKSYDNFSGITEGTKGSVKFVIETDAIE